MNKEQARAWKAAEREAQQGRKRLLEQTRTEVVELLKKAKDDITLVLAGTPTDYQQWHLTELQKEIGRVLGDFGKNAGQTVSTAAGKAWDGGIAAIDKPLAAAGIEVMLPHLDAGQLMGMRAFMVDRIEDVSSVAASKIKAELGLAMIGSQSVHDTIGKVGDILSDGSRARATTIVRTELSRAWAVASHERASQSEAAGVAMDKVWRRSGKIHSRLAHDLADGRRVPLNEAFLINGHSLQHPHDPKAPASETINCGCICLYRPRDTPGTLPDKRPFTAQELALNPNKAQMATGQSVRALQDAELRRLIDIRRQVIAESPIEHLNAWSRDGKVLFSKTGNALSVELNAAQLGQLNDAVLLHNHPGGPLSFSTDDVKLAIWHDVAETHVVDRLFRYEIVRPESANWGPAYWSRTLRPIVERVTAEVQSQLDAALKSGQITEDQYQRLFDHMVWDGVNKEADLGYRRIPRKEK